MSMRRQSGTRRLLAAIVRAIVLFVVIAAGNLAAMYVAAGVAFHGDWRRVDNAVEDAWDGLFDN